MRKALHFLLTLCLVFTMLLIPAVATGESNEIIRLPTPGDRYDTTEDDMWVEGEQPTATVTNKGKMTIPASDYFEWPSDGIVDDMPLNFVMSFLADQAEADASPFDDWWADFVITFTDMAGENFAITSDDYSSDFYLAGHYGSTDSYSGGWVKVNASQIDELNGVILPNFRYPVMAGVGMGQKYEYIRSGVKEFWCAMNIPTEVLDANPDLKVTLELCMAPPEAGDALTDADSPYLYRVYSRTFDVNDFYPYAATTGGEKYETLQAAINAADSGATIQLLQDVQLSTKLTIDSEKTITIDGSDHTISPAVDWDGNDCVIMLGNTSIFDCEAAATRNVTLQNLNITGFTGQDLQHIVRAQGVTLTMNNVSFAQNALSSASNWGILSLTFCDTDIINCSFAGNTAKNMIDVNSCGDGSTLPTLIQNCRFEENTTGAYGAAINITQGGVTTVNKNKFTGNTTEMSVIFVSDNAQITGNILKDNILTGELANAAAILAGPWKAGTYTIAINENVFQNALSSSAAALPAVWVETFKAYPDAVTAFVLNGNYWDGEYPTYGSSGTPTVTLTNFYTEATESAVVEDSLVNTICTITWVIDDETDITTVEYGTVPTHDDPVKENTPEYTYEFAGWTPEIAAVTGDATYKATFTAIPNEYTVTWDVDGEKTTQQVAYGADITAPADPEKNGHTFAGWEGYKEDMAMGAKDMTFTALWTVNKYTVTFLSEDGTLLLAAEEFEYGTKPEFPGNIPSKPNTADKVYALAGWTDGTTNYAADALPKVTGPVTYKIVFSDTAAKYTIKFVDEEGNEISSAEYDYGTAAEKIVKPADPTKAATDQYTYTFAGWDKEITAVTSDVTYKATYTATVNKYTVTFVDEDGTTVLQTGQVAYGETPVYTGETPTKAADDANTYVFSGWTPEVVSVTGETTYTATYASTTQTYTITWLDWDGKTVLHTDKDVPYGTLVEQNFANPTRPNTAQYAYAFAGWKEVTDSFPTVNGDMTFTARYDATLRSYIITFVNEDGTQLQTVEVAYGETPVYTGETPTKTATAQTTFKFGGWTPEIVPVTGDATYTAVFGSDKATYTVTWKNDDGTVIKTEKVAYGETPAYNGAEPVKQNPAAGCTYSFTGWTPEILPVTGAVSYTAVYEIKVKVSDTVAAEVKPAETTTNEVKHEVNLETKTEEEEDIIKQIVEDLNDSEKPDVQADGLGEAAVGSIDKIVEAAKIETAIKNLTDKNVAAEDIEIKVETTLDIQVKDVTVNEQGQKSMTLNITPEVKVVAVATDESGNETARETITESQELTTMTESETNEYAPVTIKIPVPSIFASEAKLWVVHEKSNGEKFVHEVDVKTDDNIHFYVEFENTNGFSDISVTNVEHHSITYMYENAPSGKVPPVQDAACAGDSVYLVTPDTTGYTFKWETDPSREIYTDGDDVYFIMPDADVIVVGKWVDSTPAPSVVVRYKVTAEAENGTIHIDTRYQRNETVTFTVTPDAGYVLKSLTITRNSGAEVSFTENADGSYTFKMPAGQVTVKAEFVLAFEDIETDHQFYEAIEWVYTEGLMLGKTETSFDRISPVTRQQVWRILARIITGEDPADMAAAKEWAMAQGIADGTNPGTAATREEFVTMLWIAYGKPAADTSVLATYADAAAISADATAAMAWAVSEGIVGGYEDGTLRPAASASRGAFAAILYRYLAK